MRRLMGCGLATAVLLLGYAAPVSAQVAEVRAGLSEFDERSLNIGADNPFPNVNSVAVTAEVLFEEPEFLKWALSPQPYVGGAVNLGGRTSYGGAGLLWRQNLGKKFYGDFAFGLVVHDGEVDIKFPDNATRQTIDDYFAQLRNEKEFGSRVLFREQLTLGYRVNEKWAAEVFFEHLSQGRIFSSRNNDGADILGVRAARRF